jgi:hypothetical protein
LPDEVTIVVRRGKFRWSGRFGWCLYGVCSCWCWL